MIRDIEYSKDGDISFTFRNDAPLRVKLSKSEKDELLTILFGDEVITDVEKKLRSENVGYQVVEEVTPPYKAVKIDGFPRAVNPFDIISVRRMAEICASSFVNTFGKTDG